MWSLRAKIWREISQGCIEIHQLSWERIEVGFASNDRRRGTTELHALHGLQASVEPQQVSVAGEYGKWHPLV